MYVYILRSQSKPDRIYIGKTKNLKQRLKKHNEGSTRHTSKFRPWAIETAIWLKDENLVGNLERYLKTGSGRAFSKKRFGI